MGADIHGYIEVRRKRTWHAVFDAGHLLWRNYDMFGLFFGVRNYGDFNPIAEERGAPDDVSDVVGMALEHWDADGHSYSWLGMEEVEKVDWSQESSRFDKRIHAIIGGKYAYKFAASSELTAQEMEKLRRGETVVKKDISYRLEKMKAKDALSGDWLRLFRIMALLGDRYGKDNVRIVVWFDN